MQTVADRPIALSDSTGMRFAKLALFCQNAADNAGIGYTLGGYLQPISLSDSEGMRFAKLGAWLTLLADNISGSGEGVAVSGVDPSIESVAELAAIPTVGKAVPVIKIWIDSATLSSETWQLLAGTDATDPGSIQRPNDYNAATNAKVWYRR